jgi:hypothetical protein
VCCAVFRGSRHPTRVPFFGGVGRMGDDSSKSPLTRRVPGATRAGPASSSRPELPAELLQRMQAVVNAAHAQAKQEEEAPGKQAVSDRSAATPRRAVTTDGSKLSNGVRPKLTGPFRGRLSDEDADFDTDELPRLTASGAVAGPTLAGTTAAPPDRAVKPGRGDHAAKRDRRTERRERAAQAERERAERAAHERTAREEAERQRVREGELAARAAEVLRERERAAREKAERESTAQADRARAEQTEREEEVRARAAERERTAREQAERERAEQERTAREQAERERAERERAERDQAARERERAAHERAVQAERERTARKAELERERAAQAERQRAAEELEQARRERAERESAAPGKRAAPDLANADNTTQLIISASTNGSVTKDRAAKPDGDVEQDWVFESAEAAKPNGATKSVEHRPTAARADVLEHPRRLARQAPPRRRGRAIALVAAAAVVVAAGPIAVMLARHSPAPPDGSGSGLRNEAATWISQQVSPSDVVSCDLAMCQTLEAYGVSTGSLLVMNPGDDHIQNSEVVVSTAAIRRLFGNRLASYYAPTVLASFGSGKAKIDIRVVASHGAKVYLSQFHTDLLQREQTGAALATVSRLVLTAADKQQMVTGQVDSRILLIFTLLLQEKGSINVLGFGDSGPGASPNVPRRSVYLAETGAIANMRSTLATLHQQHGNFRPAHFKTVRFDGKRALYIEFAAPPVLGLINQ